MPDISQLILRWGVVLLLLMDVGYGEEPKPALSLLAGKWTGTLTYLDYKDNKSRITLSTKVAGNFELDTLRMQFEYLEPGGKTVTTQDWLCLDMEADSLWWDGEKDPYCVSQLNQSDSSLTLILNKKGQDNNKIAAIRKTILVRGRTLTITKQVKYLRTRKFIVRNTYSFIRE